ncbi:MAG: bifunctional NADP phosphatase/NAD kinase [Methanobacteriaceae archaeon]|jgi:NAD+ kinase|uniref:bifunctional NADP phosphatase/NAD kinase n=1 Tax=Methanobrevibacter TaxID=2172 RepID=UPI0037664E11|nr:bifunctional NADP phosphatase/NAD kinase [Methanobacteriaceae archaeon]MDD4594269.1 bifunctional NADP phosphatase/NAD kinase [Methanobacteriaceae archaeon]
MDDDEIKMCENISKQIITNVEKLLKVYVGNPKSAEFVKIGADGTPTSYIDIVAENEVIKILKNANFYSYLISEEIGELKLGKGTQRPAHITEELNPDTPTVESDLESEETKPKYIFLIDPLDGTNNAIKNIPAFGISVAVAEVPEGRVATLEDVQAGFVKNYSSGNTYEAVKGKGALMNGEKMEPTTETDLTNITLGGFTKTKTFSASKLIDTARRMRVLGSVVLELTYIASGKYDVFLDLRGSRIIDIAASKLIVEESGAIVTNKYGEKLTNELSIYERTVIIAASNQELHNKIINIINNDETKLIKCIGIVSRVDEYKSMLFSVKIIEYLLNKGINVVIEESLANKLEEIKINPNLKGIIEETIEESPEISEHLKNLDFDINFEKLSQPLKNFKTDMAVILGGDGTLLRTQNQLTREIPIFGINMGTVGFLTEIEVNKTFETLDHILNGDYYKENRTQLTVSHENQRFPALNEVVIMTAKPAKMLHFEISVDGEMVEEFRADGLIISTPSGSTAYSMSAGGPIVDPKVGGFIIIPICPYKLGLRPFLVSDNSEIRVKLLKKGKKAVYVMDGQIHKEINYMEELIFKKSEKDVVFIRTNNKYFYKKVKDKLNEGGISANSRSL